MVYDTQSVQQAQSLERNTYSEVMKTIQDTHPPQHHSDFVVTCQLWTTSDGVHNLLVLQPTECSRSTKQGA